MRAKCGECVCRCPSRKQNVGALTSCDASNADANTEILKRGLFYSSSSNLLQRCSFNFRFAQKKRAALLNKTFQADTAARAAKILFHRIFFHAGAELLEQI